METEIVTPATVEKKFLDLSKEIDEAHSQLEIAERRFHNTKADFEIAMAHSRLKHRNQAVLMREDLALVDNESLCRDLATAEALVRASRANASRLETQVDLARSMGTSVRASMVVGG